jgi:acyl-coenzyme A thioesterase PaaI-like protein
MLHIAPSDHLRCFACGLDNVDGLNLSFLSDGEGSVVCECAIPGRYQGYDCVAQGGIVSTLLDSAMTNCLFSLGIAAMTARLNVRFRHPVLVNVPLKLNARRLGSQRHVHRLEACIEQEGLLRASADARFIAVQKPAPNGRE